MPNDIKCPFCGGRIRPKLIDNSVWLFQCVDKFSCGAIISFDNEITRFTPGKAANFMSKRPINE